MSELSRDPVCLVSDLKFLAQPFYAGDAIKPIITQEQRQAAAALIDHTNGEILAWLKFARSVHRIEPIAEQRPGIAQLSPSQLRALFVLKDCPNDTLLGCLELARFRRMYKLLT